MKGYFSHKTIQIIEYSKEEAERLNNNIITPNHLLLGVIRDNENLAAKLLSSHLQTSLLKIELDDKLRDTSAPRSYSNELKLSPTTFRLFYFSTLEAQLLGSSEIQPEHLLLGILKMHKNIASKILIKNNINYDIIFEKIRTDNQKQEYNMNKKTETNHNIEISDKNNQLSFINSFELNEDEDEDDLPLSNISNNKQQTTKNNEQQNHTTDTPVLDTFATNLSLAAKENHLDPVIGREKEIERLSQIICRRKKNNPLLIGEPGVGKSAIIEGLAIRINQRKVSPILFNKKIFMLDIGQVVAGTKYRGQFEERIKAILQELKENPQIIVFIDEIHTLIGAGNTTGSMDAANMLKPALARGEFQCIGATTLDEYKKTIEKDGALDRRFQRIIIQPTTTEETLKILQNIKERYEDHHNVRYTEEAILSCVNLTERYISDRFFPDKAIDALDETGARIHASNNTIPEHLKQLEEEIEAVNLKKDQAVQEQNFEEAADLRDKSVKLSIQFKKEQEEWTENLHEKPQTADAQQVAEVVSMISGIPVQQLTQDESDKLLHMGDELARSIIGQEQAIKIISKAIQRNRMGLKDPNRPIGAFLFMGPTGTGKTYLAQKLAEQMFGSQEALIRIDMSEYMDKYQTSRLIGSAPGYVGYEEGGQLTEKVRRKPYSIILFDEIEKAHPDVFNIFLQIMDEGRISDNTGRIIDFKNTILILTSNIGSRQLAEFGNGIGFDARTVDPAKRAKDISNKALKKTFAPEFLNRLDEIVNFDPLSKDSILKIIDLEINKFIERVEKLGYHIKVSTKVKERILKEGYDNKFGARPLKRAIQKHIEDIMATKLLQGKYQKGETIKIN